MLTRRRFVDIPRCPRLCWRIAHSLGPAGARAAPAAPGDPRQRVSAPVEDANPRGPLSGWLSVRRRMAHAQVQVVSVYVDQLERQADAAPSPYQLAMAGTKVAPASAAKGIAGGLGGTAP